MYSWSLFVDMKLLTESLQKLYLKHKIATEIANREILKFIQEENMVLISDIFKGNKEDLDYLIELGKELKTQDNLGTRKPLIFRIQDIEVIECEEGIEDFKRISFDDKTHVFSEEQTEEAKDFVYGEMEFLYPDEVFDNLRDCIGLDDLIIFCNTYDIEHEVLYFANELRYKEEFLTRIAAKEHLKKFRYRYSNEAKVYCSCAAENEEITKLTEVLERLYEINCKEEL